MTVTLIILIIIILIVDIVTIIPILMIVVIDFCAFVCFVFFVLVYDHYGKESRTEIMRNSVTIKCTINIHLRNRHLNINSTFITLFSATKHALQLKIISSRKPLSCCYHTFKINTNTLDIFLL